MKAIQILKELYYDPAVPLSVRKKIRKAIIEVMREEEEAKVKKYEEGVKYLNHVVDLMVIKS
jgi:uncharacterized protein (UPF0147 family)